MIFLRRYKRFICNYNKECSDFSQYSRDILMERKKINVIHINDIKIYICMELLNRQREQLNSPLTKQHFIAIFRRRLESLYVPGINYEYYMCLPFDIDCNILNIKSIRHDLLYQIDYKLAYRKINKYVYSVNNQSKTGLYSVNYNYHGSKYQAAVADYSNYTNIYINHDITDSTLIGELINECGEHICVAYIREFDKPINVITPTKRYLIGLNLQEVKI